MTRSKFSFAPGANAQDHNADLDAAITSSPVSTMDIRQRYIHPNPYQARTEFSDLEELMESINQHGFQGRLRVRPHPSMPGQYQLAYGERRLRAMRMLDYERLYRKQGLTDEELQLLREHVLLGAAMVEPVLGHEIARAVLCHHERADGRGYQHELHGDEIPLPSRILQIVDAYLSMTDPHSYHQPESHGEALNAIARGAGAQFDADLAAKFIEMMKMA